MTPATRTDGQPDGQLLRQNEHVFLLYTES